MFTDTIQYHKKVTKTITYLITIKEISVFHIRLSVGPLVLMSKLDCFTPPPKIKEVRVFVIHECTFLIVMFDALRGSNMGL